MNLTKITMFLTLSLASLCSHADIVEEFKLETPLFCDNANKTISYVIISSVLDSLSTVTDIAYFTDGYPNTVRSDLVAPSKSSVQGNRFDVELRMLYGPQKYSFRPQLSGPYTNCTVTVSPDWKSKLEHIDNTSIFETDEFEAKCTFPAANRMTCRSSSSLEKKLYLNNPSDGKKLHYTRKFTYRTESRP